MVSAVKGLEAGSLLRMSQVLRAELPEIGEVVVVSGPSVALELAPGGAGGQRQTVGTALGHREERVACEHDPGRQGNALAGQADRHERAGFGHRLGPADADPHPPEDRRLLAFTALIDFQPPIDIKGQLIYYVGPTPARPGRAGGGLW